MSDQYDPASRPCAKGPTPGCHALYGAVDDYWPASTGLGTWVCRQTAGGTASVHGNGRAGDNGPGRDPIDDVVDWLLENHTVLGVQLIIWKHRIWSVARADEGWRPYGCDKPGSHLDHHTGHVHWEVNRHAGATLTRAAIDRIRPGHAPTNVFPDTGDDDMPRIVHSGGAIFAVGTTNDVFTDVKGVVRTGPWRRTFENVPQLVQHIGGGGYTTKVDGSAFDVTIPHDVFEKVYGDLGRVQP